MAKPCRCYQCAPTRALRADEFNLFTRAEIHGIAQAMIKQLRGRYKEVYDPTGMTLDVRLACPLIKAWEEIDETLWIDQK